MYFSYNNDTIKVGTYRITKKVPKLLDLFSLLYFQNTYISLSLYLLLLGNTVVDKVTYRFVYKDLSPIAVEKAANSSRFLAPFIIETIVNGLHLLHNHL